eukprot:gene33564-41418_t
MVSGKQILIYVGGSDNIVQHHPAKYLASPAVKRLVMEQSYSEIFTNNEKVVLMPIGLCAREITGQNGIDLKAAIAYSETVHDVPQERNDKLNGSTSTLSSGTNSIAKNTPFVPTDLQKKTWAQRKERVFFCFQHKGEGYVSRYRALMHVIDSCDFCDICKGSISHAEMWTEYANYKYVYSPLGNGQDCFRSWEIMLM